MIVEFGKEFTLVETQSEPIITVCRIIELSNHYK